MDSWVVYRCAECGNSFSESIDDTKKAFEIKQYRCNCCAFGREQVGFMTASRIMTLESQVKEIVAADILNNGSIRDAIKTAS